MTPSYSDLEAKWPGRPPYILDKLLLIEVELDQIHVGWRERKPFDRTAYKTKARIKWLLKRHSLLTHTEDGQVAPLDWDVLIVQDGKNPNKCYAHPVIPAVDATPVTRVPESPLGDTMNLAALHAASRPTPGSTGHLAALHGVTVEAVERAMSGKPLGWMGTDSEWLTRSLKPTPLGPPAPAAPVGARTASRKPKSKVIEESSP